MGRVLPILFNARMVQAILDGRKTVTRRAIKYIRQDIYDAACVAGKWNESYWQVVPDHLEEWYIKTRRPPCRKKDILYVRETWAFVPCIECAQDDDGKCSCNKKPVTHEDRYSVSEGCFLYRAGCETSERISWHPSIHMPKQAARIWLRVTDVRVERLQDITQEGILAEGVINQQSNPSMGKRWVNMQRMEFEEVWDSTIKKPELARYGWDANPWVWVIEFERCGKPEGNGK